MSAESQELQEILSKIDVSDIASVEFFPVDGESFRLDTDNIKKLTRYITTKHEKEYFQPYELDKTYGYIIDHLYTEISDDKYADIRKQMKVFVEQGGSVEIHTQSVREENQKPNQKQYSSTGRFFQVFISILMILLGGVFTLCGSVFFAPKTAFSDNNPFIGFVMLILAVLLISRANWLIIRKGHLYQYIMYTSLIILFLSFGMNHRWFW